MVVRSGVASLIPEDASREIIMATLNQCAAMQLMRKTTMKQKQKRLPILETLPDQADFLPNDTSLKPISEMTWTNKFLNAEPIGTIVFIPEDVVDDIAETGGGDIWEQIKPLVAEDIARKLDNAIFFGVGAPATWPTAIVPAAIAAGNTVNLGAGGAGSDSFADINTAMMTVEADGYDVNGFWARQQFKGTIRNERDANRGFLYPPNGPANVGAANNPANGQGVLFGEKLVFSKAGLSGFSTASGNAHLITGDFQQALFATRKQLEWKVLDQATLYNTDGSVRIALAQQDALAIRVFGRFAWQVPNPINRMQPTEASRYPFAVVRQP